MTTRSELYQKFGPLLLETIVLIMKDEINILRVEVGLSERTNQQILDALDNKLHGLDVHDWMIGLEGI